MTDSIQVSVDIPPGSDPETKTALRAGAYQRGLALASSSPQFRLHMILGEAYQRYLEIARWVAAELEKDEAKAPGLLALASRFAARPGSIGAGFPDDVDPSLVTTQEWLLHEAVDELQRKKEFIE